MATKQLRDLRQRYRLAYTAYMHCVHELADASQRAERPRSDLIEAEDRAFRELAEARQSLMDALLRCDRPDLPRTEHSAETRLGA